MLKVLNHFAAKFFLQLIYKRKTS